MIRKDWTASTPQTTEEDSSRTNQTQQFARQFRTRELRCQQELIWIVPHIKQRHLLPGVNTLSELHDLHAFHLGCSFQRFTI